MEMRPTKEQIAEFAAEIQQFLIDHNLWHDTIIHFNGTAFASWDDYDAENAELAEEEQKRFDNSILTIVTVGPLQSILCSDKEYSAEFEEYIRDYLKLLFDKRGFWMEYNSVSTYTAYEEFSDEPAKAFDMDTFIAKERGSRILVKENARCLKGEHIVIPEIFWAIDDKALADCFYFHDDYFPFNSKIKTVVIPNTVTDIGEEAFAYCKTLTDVTISESVKAIGKFAFADCDALESILIPDNVTKIEESTFDCCTSLKSVAIGSGVTSIEDYAFSECVSLKKITIPNSVKKIGSRAFEGCTSLEEIVFPDSLTYVGVDAFYDTAWFNNHSTGMVYAGKIAYEYKGNAPRNGHVILRDDTTAIAPEAFLLCSNLRKITIPNSVTVLHSIMFVNGDDDFPGRLTFCCGKNSAAHIFAKNNGVNVELTDS